jgi:glycosyltransferase 2 family protein
VDRRVGDGLAGGVFCHAVLALSALRVHARVKLPIRTLLVILGGAATAYALALLLTGQAPLARLVAALCAPEGIAAAALCVLNYLLRGWRWRGWMTSQGRPLQAVAALRYYLAGYTFTPTPANVGESLRGMMLHPPMPANRSLAVFGAERIADLLALVLLTWPAAFWLLDRQGWVPASATGWLMTGGAVLVAIAVALLAWKRAGRGAHALLQGLLDRAPAVGAATQCLGQRPGAWLSLTLLAWAAQGLATWLLCSWAGISITPALACGIYALAMVGGALSMLPAGLGGTEALLTGLLVLHGAPLADAALATILVRVLTLWLAVGIGAICLLYSAAYRKDLRLG